MAWAYADTYKLPTLIVHCTNVFGIRQHPEKFIPLVVKKVLAGDVVQIHADPTLKHVGSRYYIHAYDVASALLFLAGMEWKREKVNIPGQVEIDNLEMAQRIASILCRELRYEIIGFRLGDVEHDLRYALADTVLMELGWCYSEEFEEALEKTVLWTAENTKWLNS